VTAEAQLALFLLVGQTATRTVGAMPTLVPQRSLPLSDTIDLAVLAPEEVRLAIANSEPYQLFFVFERYLRDFVVEVLSNNGAEEWWPKVPKDVQDDVEKLAELEETKAWMALGSRDRSLLLTYPQLLKVIDETWKTEFADYLRDKGLIQEARLIGHIRNALCHMAPIPEEELQRVRLVMRDWFRMLPP
jgi:Swt1-like HEPN